LRDLTAHLFAHPFSPIGWTKALPLAACRAVTRDDGTGAHLLDRPARSLKVATRFRIPLGLQKKAKTQVVAASLSVLVARSRLRMLPI
jgi:hypothetical protein